MGRTSIDYRRLETSLRQATRTLKCARDVEDVIGLVEKLIEQSGTQSGNRQTLYRLAKVLLLNATPRIIAPVCPDYSHADGRYTFRGISNGVPLLAKKHTVFLDVVCEVLPSCEVLMLVADHEADDEALCRAVNTSQGHFRDMVAGSVLALRKELASRHWSVECMTSVIPNLVEEELTISARIGSNASLASRLASETFARSDMYLRISRNFSREEMLARTIKTAAQYVVMGEFAAKHGNIVCNHTTTNLSWYRETDAALLHNPISVY